MGTLNIGGSEGNSFPFDKIGDTVSGSIVDMKQEQSTDMDSGQPAVWPDGNPKMHYRITLQTDLRDPADPSDKGLRDIFVRGSRKPESKSSLSAVLGAVKSATGGSDLATGAVLSMTYIGDGVPTTRDMNAPKQYSATYKAPTLGLGAPTQQQPTPSGVSVPTGIPAQPVEQAQPAAQANQLAALAALGITPEQLAALAQSQGAA